MAYPRLSKSAHSVLGLGTVAETESLAPTRLCQSRSGFTQPTTFVQPLKDADDLCKGARLQWRARIMCLPVLHGPFVGRDQLHLCERQFR